MQLSVTAVIAIAILTATTFAGPVAYATCQTACNAGYVLCCSSAVPVAGCFGFGLGIPAAVAACSAVQGTCMAACTPLLVAPTP